MKKLNVEKTENFVIECVEYLNIGTKVFNVGDTFNVVSSVVQELDDGVLMIVYETQDKIGICDFELKEYFKIIQK